MESRIKQRARELGFDLCGIAAAGPSLTHPHYVEWLAHGYHAHMSYLARPDAVARRADLRQLLPSAKSVVVVALNYYQVMPPLPTAASGPACPPLPHFPTPPLPHSPTPPFGGRGSGVGGRGSGVGGRRTGNPPHGNRGEAGRVARYAWGPDYHHSLAARLKQLAAWVEAEAGRPVAHKVCVDTSAVLEREWAWRAGLGWIGKNTLLINPRLGSWLLLGELLLELDLEPDPPFEADRCGSCARCIEACPAQCILPDRRLDASRCISYLTIELQGDIPAGSKASAGRWIFGCDACQEACPWNRFALPSRTIELNPAWTSLDPAEVAAMDEATFRARFAGSALMRARRAGLARNAAMVMENVKRKASLGQRGMI